MSREPHGAPAARRVGVAQERPVDGEATRRVFQTPGREAPKANAQPDEDYWQRVIDRATD